MNLATFLFRAGGRSIHSHPTSTILASAFGVAVIILLPIYVAYSGDIFRPFDQVYDADLYYTYNALAFNQGLPQLSYDHTGYTYSLILSWWVRAAHLIGVIDESALYALRASPDAISVLAQVVQVERVLSAVLSMAFAAAFAFGVWRLTREPVLAAGLGAVLAATLSVQMHALFLRPELVSAFGIMGGFLFIAMSGNRAGWSPFFLLAAAAAAVYLGVLAKMQAIIPAMILPVFGIVWGIRAGISTDGRDLPWTEKAVYIAVAARRGLAFREWPVFRGLAGSRSQFSSPLCLVGNWIRIRFRPCVGRYSPSRTRFRVVVCCQFGDWVRRRISE